MFIFSPLVEKVAREHRETEAISSTSFSKLEVNKSQHLSSEDLFASSQCIGGSNPFYHVHNFFL